jgi:hypothetical protein
MASPSREEARRHSLVRARRTAVTRLAIGAVLFIGLVIASRANSAESRWLNAHGVMTEASVLSINCAAGSRSCGPSGYVAFRTQQGEDVRTPVWLTEDPPLRVGQLVAVLYNPSNPEEAQPVARDLQSLPPVTEAYIEIGYVIATILLLWGFSRAVLAWRAKKLVSRPSQPAAGFILRALRRRFELVLPDGTHVSATGRPYGFLAYSWNSGRHPVEIYGSVKPYRTIVTEDPSSGQLFIGRVRRRRKQKPIEPLSDRKPFASREA